MTSTKNDFKASLTSLLHGCLKCMVLSYNSKQKISRIKNKLKADIALFFVFSPKDSSSKTMKNAFYFISKALFILEMFKFLKKFSLLFHTFHIQKDI